MRTAPIPRHGPIRIAPRIFLLAIGLASWLGDATGRAQLPAPSGRDRLDIKDRSVADPPGACRVRPLLDLSVRSELRRAAMAMDQLGRRSCGDHLARSLGIVLMVCRKFRELQQNLRFARSDYRVMTWMWLSIIVVLAGGKLNAEIDRGHLVLPASPKCPVQDSSKPSVTI
jgi:hypothetical protein